MSMSVGVAVSSFCPVAGGVAGVTGVTGVAGVVVSGVSDGVTAGSSELPDPVEQAAKSVIAAMNAISVNP